MPTGTINAFPINTTTLDSLSAATALTGAEILTVKQGGLTLQSTPAAVVALATQALIGAKLHPQTTAEAAAGVMPVNLAYAPYNVKRYGALGDGSDCTAAINN